MGVHRRHVARVRRDEGDPRHSDHGDGAEPRPRCASLPRGAALPRRRAVLDKSVRERWNDYGIGLLLQGDLKGAEAAFLKVTRDGAGLRRRLGERRRARGSRKATWPARRTILRKALEVDPELAKTHFFLGTVLKSARRYDEALDAPAQPRPTQYPRDRVVLQPARTRAVPEAAVQATAIDEFQKVLDDRSRRSAGALQPDAVLPGAGRRRAGRARARRSTSASRPTSRRRRSPGRTGSCIPTTTTSASRSTSTRSAAAHAVGRRDATELATAPAARRTALRRPLMRGVRAIVAAPLAAALARRRPAQPRAADRSPT